MPARSPPQCSLLTVSFVPAGPQMLFTWDTTNLCIVFEQWHIRSTAGLLFSLIAVVLIGMGYEALRAGTRRYEVLMDRRLESTPSESAPVCPSCYETYMALWNKTEMRWETRLAPCVVPSAATRSTPLLALLIQGSHWTMFRLRRGGPFLCLSAL